MLGKKYTKIKFFCQLLTFFIDESEKLYFGLVRLFDFLLFVHNRDKYLIPNMTLKVQSLTLSPVF